MVSKLLVTGLSGFVGRHLETRLQSPSTQNWQLIPPQAHNLTNAATLDAWLEEACPDAVIHLAGQTFVPEAFRDPSRTLNINLLGTLNLLQALKRRGFQGVFLYVSSGDVYGQVGEANMPIREELLPRPRNPYAVSKLSAELLCLQWGYTEPWRVLVARPFNHIGSGQGDSFVIPSMAKQLVRVRCGLQPAILEVGDIDVSRDFLDVRDVVEAYLGLLDKGRSGEVYNVCSGQERTVRDMIMDMSQLAGVEVELVQDPARLRKSEQRRVVGSFDKLKKETGWQPGINIMDTLQSVLSDWAARER